MHMHSCHAPMHSCAMLQSSDLAMGLSASILVSFSSTRALVFSLCTPLQVVTLRASLR